MTQSKAQQAQGLDRDGPHEPMAGTTSVTRRSQGGARLVRDVAPARSRVRQGVSVRRGRKRVPGPILHVAPFLWSGAGAVITRLCEDQRQGSDVAIVTSPRRAGLGDWACFRRRLRRAGVCHFAADVFRREASTFWTSVELLRDIVRDMSPRLIHAHAGVPTAVALLAREGAGQRVPVVAQMYSWGPRREPWMNRQDLWAFSQADYVICSATAYRDLLLDAGVSRSRLSLVRLGLPLREFAFRTSPPGPREDPRTDGPTLGFVGRLEPRKGQLRLVEAFSRVVARWPGAVLELVGPAADTEYEREVRARVDALGLGRSVAFVGRVPIVSRRIREWSLFVSGSEDEGQGLAVLEAMALGVPVVACSAAGLDDFLVHGRNALVVRHRSAAALSSAINSALDDPSRLTRLARSARLMVERQFDWQDTVARVEGIYRHVSTRGG